jgi:hypothetical protein
MPIVLALGLSFRGRVYLANQTGLLPSRTGPASRLPTVVIKPGPLLEPLY